MSTFAWLDYSEKQRRRMLEVVEFFRDESTVDELGLGAVRDALSETLFPGTSTLHTRFRYLLFLPWIYVDFERRKVGSDRVEGALKRREVELIDALKAGGETEGVIGIEARARLNRFPSLLYWNALERFGIRLFRGSQQQYHRSLDGIYDQRVRASLAADDEASHTGLVTWHPSVPEPPEGWLEATDFALRLEEAELLQHQVLQHAAGSLLGYLVTCEHAEITGTLPWESPLIDRAPAPVRHNVEHAQCFSELLHGAALLYNLILADKIADARQEGFDSDVDRSDEYRERLADWAALVRQRGPVYAAWDRQGFWQLIRATNPRLSPITVAFVDRWIDLVLAAEGEVADHEQARQLISEREIRVKRGLARVANLRALEQWNGASGVAQLTFRWRQGQQFAQDVIDGQWER